MSERWGPFFYVKRGDVFDVVADDDRVGFWPEHVCTTTDQAWAERIAEALSEPFLVAPTTPTGEQKP